MPSDRKPPARLGETLNVTPIRPLPATEPRPGRKPKPKMPNLPDLFMTDYEATWFKFHQDIYEAEYPDMTETDRLTLLLASIEFIKYLRMVGKEMEAGELISQARQHPLIQYRALMDSLAVTRKARQANKTSTSDHDDEARKFFEGIATR